MATLVYTGPRRGVPGETVLVGAGTPVEDSTIASTGSDAWWQDGPRFDVLAGGLRFRTSAAHLLLVPDTEDEEDDPPASYLDRVDGHWYVCRYDRTLPQIHAQDCATCEALR